MEATFPSLLVLDQEVRIFQINLSCSSMCTKSVLRNLSNLLDAASGGHHDGSGGSVFISGGDSKGAGVDSIGGSVRIAAGSSPSHGGDMSLLSGSGLKGGSVLVSSSTASGANSTSGDVRLASGNANAVGASSGSVVIASGDTVDSTPGTIRVIGGNSDSGRGSDVNVFAGEGTSSGIGGALSLRKFYSI